MRVNKYKTKLNDDGLAYLVKEASHNYNAKKVECPADIDAFCCEFLEMHRETEEYVYLLCYNTANKLIGYFEISHGAIDKSICGTREIILKALLSNARNVVVVHNHPSGDNSPSDIDIMTATKLNEAMKLVGINLMDFMIIGDSYTSFKTMEII